MLTQEVVDYFVTYIYDRLRIEAVSDSSVYDKEKSKIKKYEASLQARIDDADTIIANPSASALDKELAETMKTESLLAQGFVPDHKNVYLPGLKDSFLTSYCKRAYHIFLALMEDGLPLKNQKLFFKRFAEHLIKARIEEDKLASKSTIRSNGMDEVLQQAIRYDTILYALCSWEEMQDVTLVDPAKFTARYAELFDYGKMRATNKGRQHQFLSSLSKTFNVQNRTLQKLKITAAQNIRNAIAKLSKSPSPEAMRAFHREIEKCYLPVLNQRIHDGMFNETSQMFELFKPGELELCCSTLLWRHYFYCKHNDILQPEELKALKKLARFMYDDNNRWICYQSVTSIQKFKMVKRGDAEITHLYNNGDYFELTKPQAAAPENENPSGVPLNAM